MDKNRERGYAEPDANDLQWQRTSQTTGDDAAADQEVRVSNTDEVSENEDDQEGTVAVGSGLGIDE